MSVLIIIIIHPKEDPSTVPVQSNMHCVLVNLILLILLLYHVLNMTELSTNLASSNNIYEGNKYGHLAATNDKYPVPPLLFVAERQSCFGAEDAFATIQFIYI